MTELTTKKKVWLIVVSAVLAGLALLAVLVVAAIKFLPIGGENGDQTATTTTATTTSTTVATTTTTRIWNQNGRNICKTCNYVYDETLEECPACAGEASADRQCPTCLGAHEVDEGQPWEYCSFCEDYFVVTEGAVHFCRQCKTEGLTAEMLDPEKGNQCQKCIDGTHVCAKCGANCHGQYRLSGEIACESCYAKVMYRTCDWCHTRKASVREVDTYAKYQLCDDCFVCRREATAAEYEAYIAWSEATYGPLDPVLGLNGRLEVCPHCGGKSVHNGIVYDCDDCGRNSLPPGTHR